MTDQFEPTDEQRRMVKVMSGFGIPQPDIATHLGIDAKTLRKHFREELDRGMTEANMRVAQSLFNMATTGGNVAAAIFWMKARAGWREKHEVILKEDDDTANLTDEELLARIKSRLVGLGIALPVVIDGSPAFDGSLASDAPCSTPSNDR